MVKVQALITHHLGLSWPSVAIYHSPLYVTYYLCDYWIGLWGCTNRTLVFVHQKPENDTRQCLRPRTEICSVSIVYLLDVSVNILGKCLDLSFICSFTIKLN